MISVREEARGDTQAFPNQWKTLHPRSSLWDSSLSCADGLGTLISKMFAAIKMVMTWKNILKDLRRPKSFVYCLFSPTENACGPWTILYGNRKNIQYAVFNKEAVIYLCYFRYLVISICTNILNSFQMHTCPGECCLESGETTCEGCVP